MALMPFEKHPADTGTMTASATTLEQKAAKCLDQKEITDKAYNPAVDSWDGICAPELRKAPKPLRDSAETANKQLAWAAVPINYAAGKVKEFNAKVGTFETASEKPDTDGGHPTQSNKAVAMADYREAYETYIVDGFTEAAGMFKDGPTDENIKLAKAAGAIPNAPTFTVFGQMWHEDNVKKAVTEADKLIQQISDGKYTDMKTPLGPLVDLLKKYGTDQMFAAMLLNKIGPDGMLRLNQIVAQSESDTKPDDYNNKDGGPRDNALGDLIGQFQKSLGITLGTATGGQDGYDPGTRDDYRLDGDFTERLNELGREKSTIKWPGEDDYEYGTELYGYQVLAPLLKTGEFSSDFLTDVGNGMYYFDKGDGEHGGGPWMDTVANLRSDHGIRLDWTEGTGSTHASGFDPMGGLMTALGNNPQASHDFFTDSRSYTIDGKEGHDQDQGYNEKVRYLLNERHWGLPNDQPYMGDGTKDDGYYDKKLWEEQNNTHAMDPLGKALTAATGQHDQASATLFGDVVYEASSGDGIKSGKFVDLRDDFADMSVQHIGAINEAFIGDGGPGSDGDIDHVINGIQYDPGFDTTNDVALEKFLAEIGHDEDAKTHLTAAEGLYMQAGYHHYMDQDGTLDDRIRSVDSNVNNPLGHVLGALDYGAGDATYDDHKESDKEHNDGVDDKYKIIGFFTDKLPFDKIPVGGDLVKEGVGSYLDALKESEHIDTSDVANSLIGNMHSTSENHIQTTAETTLYASMSEKDKEMFGDSIPRNPDGTSKPMSDWTANHVAHRNDGLRDNSAMSRFTKFGSN